MSENTELLTAYDENLNPIGNLPRSEIHARGLLHRVVHLWIVENGRIWLQRRALDKLLYPGRFDQAATGHVDPGETPLDAVLRESREELGIELSPDQIVYAGDVRQQFARPGGGLDNEIASVFLYRTDVWPSFCPGPELHQLAEINIADFERLLLTGAPAFVNLFGTDRKPRFVGTKLCERDDFCILDPNELNLIRSNIEPDASVRG